MCPDKYVMTLYQELTRQASNANLSRYTNEDLNAIRIEIDEFLQSCRSTDALARKIYLSNDQLASSRISVGDVIQRWYDDKARD